MGILSGMLCAMGAWGAPAPLLPLNPVLPLEFVPGIAEQGVIDVQLATLIDAPEAWLGVPVRFDLVLAEADVLFQPWFSSFGPRDFGAISAWSDNAPLWEPAAHAASFGHLFLDRSAPAWGALRHGATYERFACLAVVREVHLGQPWIELVEVESSVQDLASGTVLHAGRAVALWEEGKRQLALSELERARLAPLPAIQEQGLGQLEATWRKDLERRPPITQLRHGRPAAETVYRLKIGPEPKREGSDARP